MSQNLIFDRLRQRYLRLKSQQSFQEIPFFFHQEIESILLERLSFFKQKFSHVLVSGQTSHVLQHGLRHQGTENKLFVLANGAHDFVNDESKGYWQQVTIDEEKLPFVPKSFDLVVSCLELQNLNHVSAVLHQNYHILQSPGLYITAFVGGDSFYELRTSLLQAEIELTDGAHPRGHPMIDFETAQQLFTQTPFLQPIVDRQFFTIEYSSMNLLFDDLRRLGARNSLKMRSIIPLHRKILKRAQEIYQDLFSNTQGDLNVTIEIIFLTGWS